MEEVYVHPHRPACLKFNVRVSFPLLVLILIFTITADWLRAQTSAAGSSRRVRVAAKPEYSALAKRLNLSGLVRVEVQIAPDGKVKKAHVIGGHPVLGIDAEKAALLTEFEAASSQTTQILEFHFGSSN
jgi:Gram-negative bacterial TonB protein C-terminal